MSKVAVRSLSSACSSESPSLARVAPRLLSLSVDALTDVLQGMASLLGPTLSALTTRSPLGPGPLSIFPKSDCCAIPEVDCPPRCVCEISWEAARGEKLRCTIRVVNASASKLAFDVEATSFAGPGSGGGTILLTPTSLQLPGGSSGVVEASFTVPDGLQPGDYEAEIVVRGSYEQCVRVLLCVTAKPGCGPDLTHCRCEITQGDPPVRIRAHRWYDHFQCSDPCVGPRRLDGDDVDHR